MIEFQKLFVLKIEHYFELWGLLIKSDIKMIFEIELGIESYLKFGFKFEYWRIILSSVINWYFESQAPNWYKLKLK